jgi:uncharacterized protein (TIGR01777 family)
MNTRDGSQTVLITGYSGFIGTRLKSFLEGAGFRVRGLGRKPEEDGFHRWDPDSGFVDPDALEGVEAVIHLAGENIAGGRWNRARRERILESRIKGTRTLVEAMRRAPVRPKVLISASGVNYYGVGDFVVDETSPPGDGFLAEVCQAWEAEAQRAADDNIRTVCLRTGVVLHPDGGAMKKLLPAYRLCLGGRISTGRQGFPWVSMDDLLSIYLHVIRNSGISGPVNAVHPEIVTQNTFNRTLSHILRRPALLPLPGFMVRILLGQMGQETLLSSLRVRPSVLIRENYAFQHDSLEAALRDMLV